MLNIKIKLYYFKNFRLSLILSHIYNDEKLIQYNLNDKKIYIKLKFYIKIVSNNVKLIINVFELNYFNNFNNNYNIFSKLSISYNIIYNILFFHDHNYI